MTECDTDALRWRVDRLQREVVALRALVLEFYRRRENSDTAIETAFLDAVGPFAAGSELGRPWSAAELLEDARRARRMDLLSIIEGITGGRGNDAVRLGCWLARHAGAEAGGYRLSKVRKESGAWLFSIVRVANQPLQAP